MFQSFTSSADPSQGAARVAALRAQMAQAGLDGVVVPLADAHQGEYVAPCDARLAWLTGFTGSAGFAVILPDQAAVFIDGRYRVQVRQQVDLEVFTPVDWPATTLAAWLRDHAQGQIGFDPWLHSVKEIDSACEALNGSGVTLVPVDNQVDAIWPDQPSRPAAPIRIQPVALAGKAHADKRAELAEGLRREGHAAAVITLCDSLSWLLNIRGSDIPRNPIVQGFAVLHDDGRVDLYSDAARSQEVTDHLGADVAVHPRAAFAGALGALTGIVLIDKGSAPQAVRQALASPVLGADPCVLPKACKTEAEIQGARDAHLRDAVAVIRLLRWLESPAPKDEISAATHLEQLRRDTGQLLDISFDTISSTGPNGAINHYRVTEDSNRPLRDGELFLIDSGGQYQDGTTDITRTVPVGPVQARHIPFYTRVLQGVIAIHRARFPKGVTGEHLDALARTPLWHAGLDFDHGTGHGVGSYLCVHEGPQRISRLSDTPLAPGMILSNEPGYYREGDFGIRLENLIAVREAQTINGQDDRPWLDFENLTWVPFCRALIDASLMTAEERAWLNAYHADTLRLMGPRLEAEDRNWLEKACAPI